jgi:type VI secretion system protein ImpF
MSDTGGLERTAKASILDRLIDRAPREGADPPTTRKASVDAHRAAVLRDVEWLLNARRSIVPVPDSLPELSHSVFAYGLPDLTSIGTDSPEARVGLVRKVRRAIETFEPRLKDVRVLIDEAAEGERQLHFTIEAMLQMEPEPERIVFDTVMSLSSGDFSVSSAP